MLIAALHAQGYDRHARPLLPTLEAALTARCDMATGALEHEIQSAAHSMFHRLRKANTDNSEGSRIA